MEFNSNTCKMHCTDGTCPDPSWYDFALLFASTDYCRDDLLLAGYVCIRGSIGSEACPTKKQMNKSIRYIFYLFNYLHCAMKVCLNLHSMYNMHHIFFNYTSPVHCGTSHPHVHHNRPRIMLAPFSAVHGSVLPHIVVHCNGEWMSLLCTNVCNVLPHVTQHTDVNRHLSAPPLAG